MLDFNFVYENMVGSLLHYLIGQVIYDCVVLLQRVHTLTENKMEGEQTVYTCPECSCMFRKLGSLNAHISRIHAVVVSLYLVNIL